MNERIRVTIEFELPHGASATACADLVLHQMRASPVWGDPAGTGHLNYICYDQTMRVTSTEILDSAR